MCLGSGEGVGAVGRLTWLPETDLKRLCRRVSPLRVRESGSRERRAPAASSVDSPPPPPPPSPSSWMMLISGGGGGGGDTGAEAGGEEGVWLPDSDCAHSQTHRHADGKPGAQLPGYGRPATPNEQT